MTDSKSQNPLILNDRIYNTLKYLAQIFLPAAGTLYFALSAIWGLPYGEQVVGTITAVDAFLGVALMISSTAYNHSESKFDGVVNVVETEDRKLFSLQIHGDPNELDQKDEVILKVETSHGPPQGA
jgi:hypothetical protein